MTKLSYFLYAADVLDSLSDFLIGFGILTILCFVIAVVIVCCAWLDEDCKDSPDATWLRAHTKSMLLTPVVLIFLLFGGSAIIPEKKTMYMIAGVEMADAFSKTETAHTLSTEMKSMLTDVSSIIHGYAVEVTGDVVKKVSDNKETAKEVAKDAVVETVKDAVK